MKRESREFTWTKDSENGFLDRNVKAQALKPTINKKGPHVRKEEHLFIPRLRINLHRYYGNQYNGSLKKVKIDPSGDLATPFLDI